MPDDSKNQPYNTAFANTTYWYLQIGTTGPVSTARFSEVTAVRSESQLVEYRFCAGNGNSVFKAPGNVSYGNLILRRGLINDLSLHDWRDNIVRNGFKTAPARLDGTLVLRDGTEYARSLVRYNFYGAWPLRLSGPALSANSTSPAVAIEELELCIDRLERIATP